MYGWKQRFKIFIKLKYIREREKEEGRENLSDRDDEREREGGRDKYSIYSCCLIFNKIVIL